MSFLMSVFTALVFTHATALADDLVVMEKSIVIEVPIEMVYEFAGNSVNDDVWREEVNYIEANGPFAVGTLYFEDAHLGTQEHFLTYTEITKMNDAEVIYETIETNPSYLKSHRMFKALGPAETEFTYRVEMEKQMIRDVLKLKWPVFAVKWVYKRRMKGYLKTLKKHLEDSGF